MRRLTAALFAAALAACGGEKPPASTAAPAAPSDPRAWTVDYAESRLGFRATQTGTAFEGRFERFEAAILFDPEDLSGSRVEVTVDMASAATGDRQRDAALPASEWFRVRDFPNAVFRAEDFIGTGEGRYEARGSLTIRDVTRPLTLPFTLRMEGDRGRAEGEVTLLRTDFGVGQGEFATDQWVGLDVGVQFTIVATAPKGS